MTWSKKLERKQNALVLLVPNDVENPKALIAANVEAIQRTLEGLGPDDNGANPDRAVHAAVNMPSIHVPAFCDASRGAGDAYKNSYDLGKVKRLGEYPEGDIPIRTRVDHALQEVTRVPQHELYFAAAELNGTGIRFYGDICLVMAAKFVGGDPWILETNSYDAVRPPRAQRGQLPQPAKLRGTLGGMAGKWKDDLCDMAALKVLGVRGDAERRLTAGQISDALLQDEDYIEILRHGSFDVDAVQEARTSAAEVALEGRIAELALIGPIPDAAEREWRSQRRAAFIALHGKDKPVRTMTTSGRIK